jgi:hypothetical protein
MLFSPPAITRVSVSENLHNAHKTRANKYNAKLLQQSSGFTFPSCDGRTAFTIQKSKILYWEPSATLQFETSYKRHF